MKKYTHSKRCVVKSTAQTLTVKAAELQAKGIKVLKLHVGQPSTGAPRGAIEAAERAVREVHGYTSSLGIAPLRERIAQYYKEYYDADLDPGRVIVTIGASIAFLLSCISCFDRGAKLAVPYPVYPGYLPVIKQVGLDIVGFSTKKENRFQPTVEDLEKLEEDIDGIVFASPSNPAGSILTSEELKLLVDYCEKKGIRIISDEIYHGIRYERFLKASTAISFSDEAIVINSFSKYYSMPGWRIGWMVVPEYMVKNIGNLIRNVYIAPPTPSQYAAIAAMDCREELDMHVARYSHNRDIFLSELPKAGFDDFIRPQGAFYFYAHVKHLHEDSHKFCLKLLEETGVVTMPGTDFDPKHGKHYVRFSYAGTTEDIEEAVRRIRKWREGTFKFDLS